MAAVAFMTQIIANHHKKSKTIFILAIYKYTNKCIVADALAFGETRSTRSVVFWRNGDTESTGGMKKRHPVALRALERLCLRRVHEIFLSSRLYLNSHWTK